MKALRYDPLRLALVQSMPRDQVIAAIAMHLFHAQKERSLQDAYGIGGYMTTRRSETVRARRRRLAWTVRK